MTKTIFLSLIATLICTQAYAENIDKNTAKMQAMDKITGRVSVINVPVNGEVKFGSLSIVVRSCKTRPAEEAPDNFAFTDITDKSLQGEEVNIFKGWMISSSPATHAVEHPIYDVWLLRCIDTKVDTATLLTEQQLAERDNIKMQRLEKVDSSQTAKQKNLDVTKPISEIEAQEENITKSTEPQIEFLYDEDDSDDENTVSETSDNDKLPDEQSSAENSGTAGIAD